MPNLATVVEENIHKEFSIMEDNTSEMWITGLLKKRNRVKTEIVADQTCMHILSKESKSKSNYWNR